MAVQMDKISLPAREEPLEDLEIEAWVRPRDIHVVAATVGEDEHSVGLHEILDIKHGGIEKYGFHCHDLGTSVPIEAVLDAVQQYEAQVVLISTIVTHGGVHKRLMEKLHRNSIERGFRNKLLLVAGGAQVNHELARKCGMDAGFGRGTTGREVASYLVKALRMNKATHGLSIPDNKTR